MKIKYIIAMLFAAILCSCDKGDFLDKKPSSTIIVPTKINELQGLLDDESKVWQTPSLGIQSSDEYYWKATDWIAQPVRDRNAYIWATNIYEGESFIQEGDWDQMYTQIFIANVVKEGADAITPLNSQMSDWRKLKGGAYFLRAKALFELAEIFCLPYDEQSSSTDLGLPIRLSSNVDNNPMRSSLKDTYSQIISDLVTAKDLLDETNIGSNRIRATKLTVYSLLARVCLSQRSYILAGAYADSALSSYNKLMDYNEVPGRFSISNDEAFYQNTMRSDGISNFSTISGILNVDSTLYNLYDQNDLRKTLFYTVTDDRVTLKRGYTGLIYPFTGLATDELYLIRAECYARNGELEKAAKDINDLLIRRYLKNTYVDITFSSKLEALDFILTERRKELAFRGARWSDVRRLNKEGYNITMKRILNNQEYTLPPNDLRFAISIPQYEINLSGIKQNPR